MMHTSSSGIWQTVWLEAVPESCYIDSLKVTPDVDRGAVHVSVATVGLDAGTKLTATVYDNDKEVGSASGSASSKLTAETKSNRTATITGQTSLALWCGRTCRRQ
jgi:hypothetical protein